MIIDNQQKIYYNLVFMKLRKWQQKVIDEFPDIIKNYRKFILKAPTGAGKTIMMPVTVDSVCIARTTVRAGSFVQIFRGVFSQVNTQRTLHQKVLASFVL